MLRLAFADSGSACKLAQDMVPTAHTQIDVRAQPLKNSAGRVPQATDETCKQTSFNQIVLVVEVSPPRFRGHKMSENAGKESVSWTTHRNGPSTYAVASLHEFKAEVVRLFRIRDRSIARVAVDLNFGETG